MLRPVKTGVIGCGAISDIYLDNMIHRFRPLEVVACSAAHLESARRKAEKFGLRAATPEEILSDPEIELVVVLTPAPAHYDLVRSALLAGKHVYTEKPIATELRPAQELLTLAKDKGLLLGSAPETFLGSGFQTARAALDAGRIGDVTSFHVVANRDLSMLAGLFKFLRLPGCGIAYDYGVYYLTVLCALLGPVESVFARVSNFARVRKNMIPGDPEFGQDYIYDNESQVHAVLTTRSGIPGTFSLNGDSVGADQAAFTIHGTKGILRLGDANQFGPQIAFLPNSYPAPEWETLSPVSALSGNNRGIGVADLARCIREGGSPLASGEMACHVLDVVEKIIESGKTDRLCRTETACSRPDAFSHWQELIR